MADAAAELEEGGMVRTLKDLFAGAAGGIAQVLLGELQVCSVACRFPPSILELPFTEPSRAQSGGLRDLELNLDAFCD